MLKLEQDYVCLLEDKIRAELSLEVNTLLDSLDVVYKTGSTNKTIEKHHNAINNYAVLLAESQTEGYGRRQKKWASPVGKNIYMSIKFFLKNSENIHFIPLITAISICQALSKQSISDCQIKWPNDIYLEGKKLGGILVESRYNASEGYSIIVGIGLNINMTENNEIDQPWISLVKAKNKVFDRNIIVATILSEFIKQLSMINHLDKIQFMLDWDALDYLKNKKIKIIENHETYCATSLGLADNGSLKVELLDKNNKKTVKMLYSAEVSIRKNDE